MGRILVLEDDDQTFKRLEETIKRELADLHPEVERIDTESKFVLEWLPDRLPVLKKNPKERPSIIIIDVMLRWTNPAPVMPPRPPEVILGGFDRAGLRCHDHIRKNPEFNNTQVILLTILTEEDIVARGRKIDDLTFISKDDEDDQEVLRRIRMALEEDHKEKEGVS